MTGSAAGFSHVPERLPEGDLEHLRAGTLEDSSTIIQSSANHFKNYLYSEEVEPGGGEEAAADSS